MNEDLAAALRETIRPGITVVLGDGAGAPGTLDDGTSVCATLSAVAHEVGSVRLVLGWLPASLDGLDPDAFTEVVTLMPGWGVRDVLRSPVARCVPSSLSGWPALMTGPLRPDVLLTRLVERDGMLRFGSEVSFQRALVEAGVPVLAITDTTSPCADAGPTLDAERVRVVARTTGGPMFLGHKDSDPVTGALAERVLRFVPAGARLQYGPGRLGNALMQQASVPLRIDTGALTDAVVTLDARGLLIGVPSATYLMGSELLYAWADGRPILRGIDYTHDKARLARGEPFVAVNTAIEIDPVGQINVEGVGDKVVGGIGGHPDFCAGARTSPGGLSIIAVPSVVNGRSPLVERLTRPVSTPAHDVDLIVTENGHADLREADWSQRRKLITELFSL